MPAMVRFFTVLLFSLTVAGCVTPQSVEPPRIALENVRLLKPEGLSQRLQVDLLVSNPNDFDIPLTGLQFSMLAGGQQFAEGLSDKRITIPRLGRATVPVEIRVSVISVFQQIQEIQSAGSLTYQVTGKAFLDHILIGSVPFDRMINVTLDENSGLPKFEPV